MLPTLDCHAHLDPSRSPEELSSSGAVLAMGISLAEAEQSLQRKDPLILWGVGCHPRMVRYMETFDADIFQELAQKAVIIGEVGLDSGSRVPLGTQLAAFRQVLKIVAKTGKMVSLHCYAATALVLRELQLCPVPFPVLHWWTGNVAETKLAVEVGCYFSIHSQVARNSKFRLHVPPDRILVESDHGYNDPPAAIPCRVGWVEYLVAQQYELEVMELRTLVWKNFSRIVSGSNVLPKLPKTLKELVQSVA
jgi:TatD DNase family protein